MKGAMAMCRVCLVGDTRLLNLSNIHLEAYEKLTNNEDTIKKEYGMPSTVCYVCHRQLQKFHMFSEMACKSQRILHDLLHNGIEVTHNALIMQPLNVILNLTLTSTELWSLEDTKYPPSTPVAVKFEPICENNEEETIEHEEYNIEEFKLESPRHVEINDDSNKSEEVRESDSDHKKRDMVNHLKFHKIEKSYSCNRCDITFTKKKLLMKHTQTHNGNKPYSCNRCHKTFTNKKYLPRHMRIHTGEKRYSCNRCDMMFTEKYSLTQHIRTHTGEKPYSCNICDMTFSCKSNLNRHIHVHSGDKPYSCDRCDMTFSHKTNLRRHNKRIHTVD